MKTGACLAVALAAGVVSATNMGPARIEARATSTSTSTGSTTLPTVTTKGNAFYVGDTRFYLRGIDYQPSGSSNVEDPLADASVCERDIPYFQELGLNVIRVYAVNNAVSHATCMAKLAEAGIYVALDVNTPEASLNRDNPAESYNPAYLQSIFATIDEFATYTNTLLFFSGNEVINAINTTNTAPYVKAVTRDMMQYIGERGLRAVPVGYSAADVSQNQYLMAQYMDCGEDSTRSDFYAINNYEWCDPSSFTTSGWDVLVDQYKNYSLPVFFSEYGCVTTNRTFAETVALYQTDMTVAISGGIVYEYSEEANGYGVVTISGDTVTPYEDQFADLKAALANVTNPTGTGGAVTTNGAQDCPGQSTDWDTSPFLGSALPATPSGALKYFKDGAGAGEGLSEDTQDQAGGSSSTASADAGSVSTTYGTAAATGSAASGSSSSSSSSSAGNPSVMIHTSLVPYVSAGIAMAVTIFVGAVAL